MCRMHSSFDVCLYFSVCVSKWLKRRKRNPPERFLCVVVVCGVICCSCVYISAHSVLHLYVDREKIVCIVVEEEEEEKKCCLFSEKSKKILQQNCDHP